MANSHEQLDTLQIRLPRAVLDRIDRLRSELKMTPTRSRTIRWLIEQAMPELETIAAEEKTQPTTAVKRRTLLNATPDGPSSGAKQRGRQPFQTEGKVT
jgi:hypothetical protein